MAGLKGRSGGARLGAGRKRRDPEATWLSGNAGKRGGPKARPAAAPADTADVQPPPDMLPADAAVWIVGKEPRGDGFDLDVLARVDTGRWLQVTGIVKGSDRLVEIEATEIEQVERPDRATPGPTSTADVTKVGPSPEVIFSAPPQDDTGVATDVLVRFQFSRDMATESFEGNVTVEYVGAAGQTAAGPGDEAGLEFDVAYRARNRVINVTFTEPLLPYRTLEVSLGSGIVATDGATLAPYTLRFSIGGS